MSNSTTLYILPDTNLPMHFRRLDEVDWRSVVSDRTPVLLIAPVLLRELEKHKVHHHIPKLQDRARSALAWFVELLEGPRPIILKNGVEVRFISHEPTIDFAEHRLSQRLADDELIATALEQIGDGGMHAVAIATADASLRVKLQSRPVVALSAPDAWRLPPAKSNQEREIQRLRDENLSLRARMPSLRLQFVDGEEVAQLKVGERRPAIPTLAEVTQQYPRFERLEDARIYFAGQTTPSVKMHSHQDLRRYSQVAEKYLEIYRQYYQAWQVAQELWSRSVKFKLRLINQGRAPATNIDVRLDVPELAKIILPTSAARWPMAPSKPDFRYNYQAPTLEQLMPYQGYLGSTRHPRMGSGGLAVSANGRTVQADWRILKHSFTEEFDEVLLVFENAEVILPVEIAATATCNEADPVEQVLKLIPRN